MTGFTHRDGRTLEVEGAALYREERGASDGEPLVFAPMLARFLQTV